MAGYSLGAHVGRPGGDHLFAHAVYLENPGSEAVVFCFVDLWSGSGYLFRRALELLEGNGHRLSPRQLVIAGTHTHLGPGQYMGNSFYDVFAQSHPGFRREVAEGLASGIASAVTTAIGRAKLATVSIGEGKLWGVGRNRSLDPFLSNFPAGSIDPWLASGSPGHGAPPDLHVAQKAVDPRVRVVTALDEDDAVIASFALCAIHATALGNSGPHFRRDWPRFAIERVRERLGAGGEAVFAVGNCAAGDISPLPIPAGAPTDPPEKDPTPFQGEALAQSVGERIGETWAAISRAAAPVHGLEIRARYDAWAPLANQDVPEEASVVGWSIGCPAIGGAEDFRSGFYGKGPLKSHEGMTGNDFPHDDPRHPMVPALGFLQALLQDIWTALAPAKEHPVHTIWLGPLMIATVPGEPTSHAAFTLEQRILAAARDGDPHRDLERVSILGYAGDYAGYFTTPSEFELQHYEGASTIYGRNSLSNVALVLEGLARGGPGRDRLSREPLELLTNEELRARWADTMERVRSSGSHTTYARNGRFVVTFAESAQHVVGGASKSVTVHLETEGRRIASHELEPVDVSVIRGLSPHELRLWALPLDTGSVDVSRLSTTVDLRDGVLVQPASVGPTDTSPTRRPTRPAGHR